MQICTEDGQLVGSTQFNGCYWNWLRNEFHIQGLHQGKWRSPISLFLASEESYIFCACKEKASPKKNIKKPPAKKGREANSEPSSFGPGPPVSDCVWQWPKNQLRGECGRSQRKGSWTLRGQGLFHMKLWGPWARADRVAVMDEPGTESQRVPWGFPSNVSLAGRFHQMQFKRYQALC